MSSDTKLNELTALLEHPTDADKALVEKAYLFAERVHSEHKRMSGEPYFNHLYATAYSLAEFGMDAQTIAAGLLHDSIEDVGVTAEEIKTEFGPEVLFLVEGVTKLGTIKYHGAQRHVESLRRLFVATSQDIRVLIIKLLDRLHNMQTLSFVPKEKQYRIASETLEIYAPLADRLCIGTLKRDLEDLAFPFVYPKQYEETSRIFKQRKEAQEKDLEKILKTLKRALAEHSITSFRTEFRVKGLYSLFRKLERKNGDVESIHDILAIRIIVPTIEDCYQVLGIVHALWRPLPGKIKDYIAFEKPNGYRSLHTTVFTGDTGIIEIQIRSEEMHKEAEFGIWSHVMYKETGGRKDKAQSKTNMLWISQLIPSLLRLRRSNTTIPHSHINISDAGEVPKWVEDLASTPQDDDASQDFIDQLKSDFFSHRIFVFTPRGDVIDLPIDSSPIDFAYAVHSDIGNHMAGAKVNGKLVSLDTHLKNGDIVEIETKNTSHPSNKWLEHARTSMARKHIHGALQKQKISEK